MKIKGFNVGVSVGLLVSLLVVIGVFGGAAYYDIHQHNSFSSSISKPLPNSKTITHTAKATSLSSLSPEQTIKREEIKQIIKAATIQTIREMEARGGYLPYYNDSYYPNKSVDYSLSFVPLYRVCGQVHYPSLDTIKREMTGNIIYLINQKLKTMSENTPTFEFVSLPVVRVNILGDKIQVFAKVYTKYKGNAIPENYEVTVPTRFKDIYNFATNFSVMMSRLRLIDYYTINTLYSAQYHYFPMVGTLTKCGDSIDLSAAQLSDHLYKLYTYTLANTEFFKKPRFNEEDPLHYYIPRVNGKIYKGLSVQLRVPDDYLFLFNKGVHITNNKWLSYFVVPIPECIQRYDVRPSFYISYVVTAKDDLLGQDTFYNFAEFSEINKGVPSSCSYSNYPNNTALAIFDDSIVDNSKLEDKFKNAASKECKDHGQKITIKVVDGAGNPVEGATVSYGDCMLGKTDREGIVKGYGIKQNDKYLVVSKQGYVSYNYPLSKLPSNDLIVRIKKKFKRQVDVNYIYLEGNMQEHWSDDFKNASMPYITVGGLGVRNGYFFVNKCEVDPYPKEKDLDVTVTFATNRIFNTDKEITKEEISKDGLYDYEVVNFPNIKYSVSPDQMAQPTNNPSVVVEGADNPQNYDKGSVNISAMSYYVEGKILNANSNDQKIYTDYVDTFSPVSSYLYFNLPIFYVNNEESGLRLEGGNKPIYLVNDHFVNPVLWGALKYEGQYNKIYADEKNIMKHICGISSFDNPKFKEIYPINANGDSEKLYTRYKAIAEECTGNNAFIDSYCHSEYDPETQTTIMSCDFNGIKHAIEVNSNNKCTLTLVG